MTSSTFGFMRSTQEIQLNEGKNLLFNYTCETTHKRINKSSDNNRKMNTIFLTSKLNLNNISDNQIQQSNSFTNIDNKILESTVSYEEEVDEVGQGQQDAQLSSAPNDINGQICVYDLLSGFPDVSYYLLLEWFILFMSLLWP